MHRISVTPQICSVCLAVAYCPVTSSLLFVVYRIGLPKRTPALLQKHQQCCHAKIANVPPSSMLFSGLQNALLSSAQNSTLLLPGFTNNLSALYQLKIIDSDVTPPSKRLTTGRAPAKVKDFTGTIKICC